MKGIVVIRPVGNSNMSMFAAMETKIIVKRMVVMRPVVNSNVLSMSYVEKEDHCERDCCNKTCR